jgi:hypothetical protein
MLSTAAAFPSSEIDREQAAVESMPAGGKQ